MSTEPWELSDDPVGFGDYNWYSDALPARKFYRALAEIGRRLQPLMTESGPVWMIRLCEQCADGRITEGELADRKHQHRPRGYRQSYASDLADELFFWVADRYKVVAETLYCAADAFAFQAVVEARLLPPEAGDEEVEAVRGHPVFAAARARTEGEWGAVVRDIYGPDPFRPVPFDSRWRTPDAVQLGRGIDADRAFDRLPILADALMDAGCDQEPILAHCRSEGPHVRGCWVVDLVLGKE